MSAILRGWLFIDHPSRDSSLVGGVLEEIEAAFRNHRLNRVQSAVFILNNQAGEIWLDELMGLMHDNAMRFLDFRLPHEMRHRLDQLFSLFLVAHMLKRTGA